MKTIAFISLKGGVGKTTSTVNVGAALARDGHRVLLADFDPQASLTKQLAAPGEDNAHETRWKGLYISPTDRSMKELEREEAGDLAARFRPWLDEQAAAGFDYVLLDSPPSYGSISGACALLADIVVVPVEASAAAVDVLSDTLSVLSQAGGGARYGRLGGVLVTRVDRRTSNDISIAPYLARELGEEAVYRTVIHEGVAVRDAWRERVPVVHLAPRSQPAVDYVALTKELLYRHAEA